MPVLKPFFRPSRERSDHSLNEGTTVIENAQGMRIDLLTMIKYLDREIGKLNKNIETKNKEVEKNLKERMNLSHCFGNPNRIIKRSKILNEKFKDLNREIIMSKIRLSILLGEKKRREISIGRINEAKKELSSKIETQKKELLSRKIETYLPEFNPSLLQINSFSLNLTLSDLSPERKVSSSSAIKLKLEAKKKATKLISCKVFQEKSNPKYLTLSIKESKAEKTKLKLPILYEGELLFPISQRKSFIQK